MMRQPTSHDEAYRWWRRAVSGERVEVHEDDPKPGYYRMRMARGGPWIPVEIWIEQEIDPDSRELAAPERIRATRGGDECPVSFVWARCRPISVEDYQALLSAQRDIGEMEATHVAIDLKKMAAIRP